ncbi:MAG: ABC transporter substrate-binding protein, partial [Burkholderiales bacterium]|nr:ABC transporter substrate-binding protein [Burkholderiales bacterium]
KFDTPSGTIDMSLGKGHQAVQRVGMGMVKQVNGKPIITNIKFYGPELISPPDGMKSLDWIRNGFKKS